MCNKIIINGGELEIETPRQFSDFFGADVVLDESFSDLVPDACLCQVDVEKSLREVGMKFSYEPGGEFYVQCMDEAMAKKRLKEILDVLEANDYPIANYNGWKAATSRMSRTSFMKVVFFDFSIDGNYGKKDYEINTVLKFRYNHGGNEIKEMYVRTYEATPKNILDIINENEKQADSWQTATN